MGVPTGTSNGTSSFALGPAWLIRKCARAGLLVGQMTIPQSDGNVRGSAQIARSPYRSRDILPDTCCREDLVRQWDVNAQCLGENHSCRLDDLGRSEDHRPELCL